MRDRTLIATKDHIIIMDVAIDVGAEISSINLGALHSALTVLSSIGFLMEGSVQTFHGGGGNWKKGNRAKSPSLKNNISLNRGGVSASKKTIVFQVMPRLGPKGNRSTFGVWLGTKDELSFLINNPEASLIIETGCDLNVYRDLDTFDYDLAENTINQGD